MGVTEATGPQPAEVPPCPGGAAHVVGVGGVERTYPIGKARKRFANGPEDSLAWFYEVVARHA